MLLLVLAALTALLVRTVRHLSPSDSSPSSRSHSFELPLYWTDVDIPSSSEDVRNQRPVYPYSVIPGGVVNARELASAVHRDPVVAAHYSDFHAASARLMRLPSGRQVYVSYRLGDHVYWTSKKVTLWAGETVLTDGIHLARTRCGNRISEVPGPTSPAEPPKKAMDKPVYSADGPADRTPAVPVWSERAAPSLLALNGPPITSTSGGHTPFVPLIPIGPCCSAPGGPSGSKNTPPPGPPSGPPVTPPPPPGPPPVSTPEPQSLLLLIAGLSVLFIVSLWRRA